MVRFAWSALRWWEEGFIVTDRRLVFSRGIVRKKLSMWPIANVTNISFMLSTLGDLFDYGTLEIESVGQDSDLRINYVPKPWEFFDVISELVFERENDPIAR